MSEQSPDALTALHYMSEGYDNHFNAGTPLMALHVAEVDAAMAERDRMLRLMTGEYRRVAEIDLIVSDEMVLDDLRARADVRPICSRT